MAPAKQPPCIMPRRRARAGRRDESGVTIVEFALIIPVFAMLLFATIDFGLTFGGYITLRNGVNAAARLASVSQVDPSCMSAPDPMVCTIQNHVGEEFRGIESENIQVGYTNTTGTSITVCAAVPLKSATGFTTPFLNRATISASSTVRIEQTPDWETTVPTNGGTLTC